MAEPSRILTLLSNRSKPPSKELTFLQPSLPLHITHLKALNSLLLPIPYPEKFYKDLLAGKNHAAEVSRLAYWDGEKGCIGAIRGNLEFVNDEEGGERGGEEAGEQSGQKKSSRQKVRIYIMTLCVRGPFRQLGVGGMLVDWLCRGGGLDGERFEVVGVYAHVWEANGEALEWYAKRGFVVEEGVVEGYYKRLKPGGARVVSWEPERTKG